MATHKSKQLVQVSDPGHQPLKSNESRGRVRCTYFQFQADRDATGDVIDQNDEVELAYIPKGARLLEGVCVNGAFGASVTADFGLKGRDESGYLSADGSTTADDPDAIATNIDVATAGKFDLFEETGYIGYEAEKNLILTALFEGANPADNVELKGYVFWTLD